MGDCRPPRRDPSISSTSTANPSRSNSDTSPSLTISKKTCRVDERGSKRKGNRKRNFHIFTIQNKLKNLKKKKKRFAYSRCLFFSIFLSLRKKNDVYYQCHFPRLALLYFFNHFFIFYMHKTRHYTVTDSRNSRFKHTFINPFL